MHHKLNSYRQTTHTINELNSPCASWTSDTSPRLQGQVSVGPTGLHRGQPSSNQQSMTGANPNRL